MNRCLQEADIPQMDDQREDHIDPERPPQRKHFKQLQTHNVSTYDVERTNDTNKGDSLLINKLWMVPRGTGRMPQVDQRYKSKTKQKI